MNTYVVNFDEGTMRVQAKNEAEALSILTEWFECSPTLLQLIQAFGDLKNRIRPGILDLFAEGTNTGIKRVANADDRYSYEELLYVRKKYFSPEALRNANGAVVNKLLALRNPRIWGEGASSCASDGSRFESWKQNLMTEWRSRYKGYGVMIY